MSVDSLEKADQMIDDLASTGRLTPALMLTAAKAYNSVKVCAHRTTFPATCCPRTSCLVWRVYCKGGDRLRTTYPWLLAPQPHLVHVRPRLL